MGSFQKCGWVGGSPPKLRRCPKPKLNAAACRDVAVLNSLTSLLLLFRVAIALGRSCISSTSSYRFFPAGWLRFHVAVQPRSRFLIPVNPWTQTRAPSAKFVWILIYYLLTVSNLLNESEISFELLQEQKRKANNKRLPITIYFIQERENLL